MSNEELIQELKRLQLSADTEDAHETADRLLLEYINDPEIKQAFDNIRKWYA